MKPRGPAVKTILDEHADIFDTASIHYQYNIDIRDDGTTARGAGGTAAVADLTLLT